MITPRGWWFLVVVLSILALGAFGGRLPLTLTALTLLLWFLGQWFLFTVRVHWAIPAIRIHRVLSDERGPVATVWAGQSVHVRTEVHSSHWLGVPYSRLIEFLPFGVEKTAGQTVGTAALSPDKPVTLNYTLRAGAPGRVRFHGLALEMSDLQGFFYLSTFVPSAVIYRVLPSLADVRGHRPAVKRRNLLPAPGLHRHLSPGSGSELLDLRDYIPGDPPKTIAWKISARRDRLMTKEFESEVPIRCTLFVDASQSVRIGAPGQNALAGIVDISAAVAQAAAGIRDYVGLCLFNDREVIRYIRPARGSRHVGEILNVLADTAGLAPASGGEQVEAVLPTAYALVSEIYPELLQPEINSMPGLLTWLGGPPPSEPPRFVMIGRLVRWLFVVAAFMPFAVAAVVVFFFGDLLYPLAAAFLPVPAPVILLIGIGLWLSAMVLYYPLVKTVYTALGRLFVPGWRRQRRWRKRLAAVLAEHYSLGPGAIGSLLEDNKLFVSCVERFLAEHQVPYALPLYDRHGRYLHASAGKIEVLARALLRAIVRVRDNELFVLFVDLLELTDQLDSLLRAVKAALARHHRVLVVCPWPPGVEPPGRAPMSPMPGPLAGEARDRMADLTATRLQQAFHLLRKNFAKMGVPVACAASGDPVQLILARLNQLRSVGLGSVAQERGQSR